MRRRDRASLPVRRRCSCGSEIRLRNGHSRRTGEHPGEQRRNLECWHGRVHVRSGFRSRLPRQRQGHVQLPSRLDPAHEASRRRDLEHGVRRRVNRLERPVRVLHEQGRGNFDDVFGRARLFEAQHPLQLRLPSSRPHPVCGRISSPELSRPRSRDVQEALRNAAHWEDRG
jgi:hypothetical protein